MLFAILMIDCVSFSSQSHKELLSGRSDCLRKLHNLPLSMLISADSQANSWTFWFDHRSSCFQDAQRAAAADSAATVRALEAEIQHLQASMTEAESSSTDAQIAHRSLLVDLKSAQAEISRLENDLFQQQQASAVELAEALGRNASSLEAAEDAVAQMQVGQPCSSPYCLCKSACKAFVAFFAVLA